MNMIHRNRQPDQFPIATTGVAGQAAAEALATKITGRSQWCSVTPLPNDRWELAVKDENAHLLKEVL